MICFLLSKDQETLEALLDTFEKRLGQVQEKMATLSQFVEARSHSLAELEDSGVTIDNFQERFEKEVRVIITIGIF